MKFRDLTKDDIKVRVQSITSKNNEPTGVVLLLYKDARCDMDILDETVGAENWQREHYECKGNLYCRVGINVNFDKPDKEPRFVWKSDCGTESNTDKEKGEASDSFKRACTNWGIGRELYTPIGIFVKATDCIIYDTKQTDKRGRPVYKTNDKFVVEKIKIVNKTIVGLSIGNLTTKKRVFVYANEKQA